MRNSPVSTSSSWSGWSTFHILSIPSAQPPASNTPSGENVTVRTLWLSSATPWPRASFGAPSPAPCRRVFGPQRERQGRKAERAGRRDRPEDLQALCHALNLSFDFNRGNEAQALHGDTDPVPSRHRHGHRRPSPIAPRFDQSQEPRGISGRNSAAGNWGLKPTLGEVQTRRTRSFFPSAFGKLHRARLIKDFRWRGEPI